MRAIVTVGLGFGDEGKGATIDYLAREESADLVVRYSGGAQAAHNVVLPDGRSHTFAQFGAGTLAGAKTYLASRVVLSPVALENESQHLEGFGIAQPKSTLVIHPNCLVATRYHAWMNQLRELDRGPQKHGSCGLGIGEARNYWLHHGADAISAADALDPQTLLQKLELVRDRFLIAAQELRNLDGERMKRLRQHDPRQEAVSISRAFRGVRFSAQLPSFQVALFEGSQGILLDEYFGFHPYTTWSTVTPRYALELLDEVGCGDFEILGITRCYSTRHGAGPFPTGDADWTRRLLDLGNPANAWQDNMRCGPLDLPLLDYAKRVCEYEGAPLDGLVVNHLDQLPDQLSVCTRYLSQPSLALPMSLTEQSQWTDCLEVIQPEYEQVTQAELLNLLAERVAPIRLTGYGRVHSSRSDARNLVGLQPISQGGTRE